MTAPKLTTPTVTKPKVEAKAPKVEAKKTVLPRGYATIEAIEAKKLAAPGKSWDTTITTGPKRTNKNMPVMGLKAPEHAPLEYPSSTEEEEVQETEEVQESSDEEE